MFRSITDFEENIGKYFGRWVKLSGMPGAIRVDEIKISKNRYTDGSKTVFKGLTRGGHDATNGSDDGFMANEFQFELQPDEEKTELDRCIENYLIRVDAKNLKAVAKAIIEEAKKETK